jgi:hypothetical protein
MSIMGHTQAKTREPYTKGMYRAIPASAAMALMKGLDGWPRDTLALQRQTDLRICSSPRACHIPEINAVHQIGA